MNFCENCGSSLEPTEHFCSKCGKSLNAKSEAQERTASVQRTRTISTRAMALIVIGILLVGVLGFSASKLLSSKTQNAMSSKTQNANSMTASQLMGWLITHGYCDFEWKRSFDPKDDWDKLTQPFIKKDQLRYCDMNSSRFSTRPSLEGNWDPSPISIDIAVGAARKMGSLDNTNWKLSSDVIGQNWSLSFTTREAAHPGAYESAMKSMKAIARALSGDVAPHYTPYDECIDRIDAVKNPSGPIYDWMRAEYHDCIKYFPQAEYLDSRASW